MSDTQVAVDTLMAGLTRRLAALKPGTRRVIGRFQLPTVEEGYKRCYDQMERRGNNAGLRAIVLEAFGGPCPLCMIPFIQSKRGHWEPGCRCFRQCFKTELSRLRPGWKTRGCGRFMVEEKLRNLNHCLRCFGDPVDMEEADADPGRRKPRRSARAKDD